MIEKQYIAQLEKIYPQYLRDVVRGIPFSPILLRGGKSKPATSTELYNSIDSYLKYEKKEAKRGWTIEWEQWQSKKLGNQRWPASTWVQTEEDYLYLIRKEKEAVLFKELVDQLLQWNPNIAGWLAVKPQKAMELQAHWKGICAVIDYLLVNDVAQYYVRSLPVPVHTKFIQQHEATILSILKCLQPQRFPEATKSLEEALLLQTKPVYYPARWLDPELAKQHTSGIEILSVPPSGLRNVDWNIKEVWLVENETNLYLLPRRRNAFAIFSRGYALQVLNDIPLFQKARLFYWGDLDEDGFIMLHQIRKLYPHVQSVFMDEATVIYHQEEIDTLPLPYKQSELQLTQEEFRGYEILRQQNGRFEQEKLKQDYIQQYLQRTS